MDIIWSFGLIVILLLALNHMAGGRSSNVLQPVSRLVSGALLVVVPLALSIAQAVLRLVGSSIKLPHGLNDKGHIPKGPTPPRW